MKSIAGISSLLYTKPCGSVDRKYRSYMAPVVDINLVRRLAIVRLACVSCVEIQTVDGSVGMKDYLHT